MEKPAASDKHVFRTFWYGPRLTWIARVCLSSFITRGHGVELFCYQPVADMPSSVVIRDAAEILPTEQVYLYRGGHAEVSAPLLHSNLFRYKLLRDIGGWWIDADILLPDGEIPAQPPDFCREDFVEPMTRGAVTINLGYGTAVMNFTAGAEIMARVYAETAAMVSSTNPIWASTGPFLLTRLVEEMGLEPHALQESAAYALKYPEVQKLLRPEDREEVQQRTRGAPFLHLYQHMLRLSGNAEQLPPEGSFLGNRMSVV